MKILTNCWPKFLLEKDGSFAVADIYAPKGNKIRIKEFFEALGVPFYFCLRDEELNNLKNIRMVDLTEPFEFRAIKTAAQIFTNLKNKREREVFILRFLKGLPREKVGRKLKISRETVRRLELKILDTIRLQTPR